MKILVVDDFKNYMKDHIDWFQKFLQDGNMIISRYNAIDTTPVAWWEEEPLKEENGGIYQDDYLWYRLLQGTDPSHFINFNEEYGYPTHLEIKQVKGKTEVREKPFPGIAYDPTSGVSHLQELFHFLSKIYPGVTLSNLYFVSEEEDYFKEVKQAQGHCMRLFRSEEFQKVIDSNFFKDYEKKSEKISSSLLPKINTSGIWSANVLFTPVEGILEGSWIYDEEVNIEEVKKRLTKFVLEGNILVLFTSLQELPQKQFEKIYAILDEIAMTTTLPSIFLFQRDIAGWQFGSRHRFEESKAFAKNEIIQKMVGEKKCYLPFGWHEEKSEIIKPFLEMLRMQGIYVKKIYAVGENVMEDASLVEQVQNMGGVASFIIPGEDPGESLVQSTKKYDKLDKAHVDKFSTYLENSVDSFEIFMDKQVFHKGKEPHQP